MGTESSEMSLLRERRLVQTFVALADTLVEGFDVVEFLHMLTVRTVELGLATESGILLREAEGRLQVVAASQERARLLELFQLQAREGPCLDAYRSRRPVTAADLEHQRDRWPHFAPRALSVGFRSVHAVPLALRGTNLGAMNLFRTPPGAPSSEDQVVVRALAAVATIGLVQHRTVSESRAAAWQLQQALRSRIAIEQAKGVLAERLGVEVDVAFALLRAHARRSNRRLRDVAEDVVAGDLAAETISGP